MRDFRTGPTYLENVTITRFGSSGFSSNDILALLAVNCLIHDNPGTGARFDNGTTMRLLSCRFLQNGDRGVEILGTTANTVTFLFCHWSRNGGGTDLLSGSAIDVLSSARVEILGGYFDGVDPTLSTEQFVSIRNARNSVVDGCLFRAASNPPKRAVRFEASDGARLSNNRADHLTMELARFTPDCDDCSEFGNQEGGGPPRIAVEGRRVFGLSSGVTTLFRYPTQPAATGFVSGSTIWVDDTKKLLVSDGAGWIVVQ